MLEKCILYKNDYCKLKKTTICKIEKTCSSIPTSPTVRKLRMYVRNIQKCEYSTTASASDYQFEDEVSTTSIRSVGLT